MKVFFLRSQREVKGNRYSLCRGELPMNVPVPESAPSWTVADLMERFGPMLLSRIRFNPAPGTATEQDVEDLNAHEDRLYELVDGVLVEKAMGFRESLLAGVLIQVFRNFLEAHRLGIVSGPDGTMRFAPRLVRIPDVAFLSWDRFPDRRIPSEPIPDLAPDLAIEVLSKSNTKREMQRKRRDYFQAGTRLVWEVDPKARTVVVYTDPKNATVFQENETLEGGEVLPGFTLPLSQLFAELDPPTAD
jgi:Uma2 family endonuclease